LFVSRKAKFADSTRSNDKGIIYSAKKRNVQIQASHRAEVGRRKSGYDLSDFTEAFARFL